MISHRKRFIFVHIPKSGGTSVTWALRKFGIWQHNADQFESIYYKHAKASDLKRMLNSEFDHYFKFTVVRNPWDWAVSNYAFNRGLHGVFLRHTDLAETPKIPGWAADWGFKKWLRWWIDTCSPQQSTLLTDASGRLLVDKVIRFEELAAEFPRLCLRLRIFPRRLPHLYKNEARGRYTDYYDDETSGWIAQHFATDVRNFGYRIEGPDPAAPLASSTPAP